MKNIIIILALLVPTFADAHVNRSMSAKRAFARDVACPATGLHKLPCKGFVIDHVKPIFCGGLDNKSNMQWQSVADAKAKDRVERVGCQIKKSQQKPA